MSQYEKQPFLTQALASSSQDEAPCKCSYCEAVAEFSLLWDTDRLGQAKARMDELAEIIEVFERELEQSAQARGN